MISMMSGKGNVIRAMTMKAAASLCMMAMIVGCSSGRDSNSRPVASGGGGVGQVQASNGALATKSEDMKDGCLTDEQKKAKFKEINEKDGSWLKISAESTVIRGFGNFFGGMIGMDNAGAYADDARDTAKMIDPDGGTRQGFKVIATKGCGPEHTTPAAAPSTVDGTSAVR